MKVGFTGTRVGMTSAQRASVKRVLQYLQARHVSLTAEHGDCEGADAEFDEIAAELGIPRHLYPSNLPQTRARCDLRGAIQVTEPAPPLQRNGWIVEAVGVLIATPKGYVEELRSGTWSTIRRARKRKSLPVLVITPDGNLVR